MPRMVVLFCIENDTPFLQQLLQKFSLADLESEDLLLILVLYLLYRESGDKELLFILGGMLFL